MSGRYRNIQLEGLIMQTMSSSQYIARMNGPTPAEVKEYVTKYKPVVKPVEKTYLGISYATIKKTLYSLI